MGTSGPESVKQASVHKKTTPASSVALPPEDGQTGPAGDSFMDKSSSAATSCPSFTGAFNLPPEADEVDFDNPLAVSDVSSEQSDYDEGEV